MIPYPYKFVDFGGTDLSEINGLAVEGIYQRIIDALNQCGEVVLYNWYFASIPIAPCYCTIEVGIDSIMVNEIIEIRDDDTVWVESLIPPPPDPPVIEPISVDSNGTYYIPEGVDGFNPVTVAVPPPVLSQLSVIENGVYLPPSGSVGFDRVSVLVPQERQYPQIPALPQEYQEVEYIIFYGNDYITSPQNNSLYPFAEIGLKAEPVSPTTYQAVCGYRTSVNDDLDWNFAWTANTVRWYIRAGSDFLQSYFEDTESLVETSAVVPMTKNLSSIRSIFYIGNYYPITGSSANIPFTGKLYYLYGLKNLELSWEFYYVPCYRKADNVIGLYDVVNSVFLTSKNGLLGKGPNKEVLP